MKRVEIDYKTFIQYFIYDYENGKIYWKKKTRNTKVGDEAGSLHRFGYIKICLNGKRVQASRLAWTLFYGREPKDCIDHIDGDRSNNRICNLREATSQQNNMNAKVRSHNKLGVRGVYKKGNRYQPRITKDGIALKLGWYDSIEEASAARREAENKLFGNFAYVNRPLNAT
jgi:hypothetical protein